MISMSNILPIYYKLPKSVRSVMATAQGVRLWWWRHAPPFERLTAEALERDSYSAEQWQVWRDTKMSFLLDHAARNVPFYRNSWQERRRSGDRASWHYIENWPVLEKESLRQTPTAFLADGVTPRRLLSLHTSGSTGKPLHIWQSRATLTSWYAQIEARRLRWFGMQLGEHWALLGGKLVAPVTQTKPPFWVWNATLRQLYMSSYHLADQWIPDYLDALKRYKVRYLWGYSSSLYALAQGALAAGRDDLKMAVALSSAEPVLDYQRAAINRAFGFTCETYGMTEIAAAASECQHGTLHEWPDTGYVELFEADTKVENSGDLVATGLINADMPLIRYRVGDRLTRLAQTQPCLCGRLLPAFGIVDGRSDDVLVTMDGRKIGRLDPVFKADLPIREAQIIQEKRDRIRVRFIPTADYQPAAMAPIVEGIQARMGAVQVVLEPVSQIARGPNAKFKAVISQLTPAERGDL